MIFGVGAFSHGVAQALKDAGASVSTWLTRDYAHHGPSLVGETYTKEQYPNPCRLLEKNPADFIIPMSIDWMFQDWSDEFLAMNIPILSPAGAAMKLERDRDFARRLCKKYKIPFPKSFVARNRIEAESILREYPIPFVLKNTLCSPTSPIHTVVCETVADTRSWLRRINYEEGVFLQEFMGYREAGHIAFVTGGEIYSLITNQEYKRAYDGNMGIVAGAPLGGLVEQDPHDKYGLARSLLHPLLPWLREVGFHGPVQVTAIKRDKKWSVLEYNVRIGVTCGPVIIRMLKEPLKVIRDVCLNQATEIEFDETQKYGCSVTLAGYGYPYTEIRGPQFPVQVDGEFDCDVWWNEVRRDRTGAIYSDGHRLLDVVAIARELCQAIEIAYNNIRKVRCSSSYYRTDIGRTLWPPGQV
jgi:phosphoribosylamine-glycine ligase